MNDEHNTVGYLTRIFLEHRRLGYYGLDSDIFSSETSKLSQIDTEFLEALFLTHTHISRSLRRGVRRSRFSLATNTAFEDVLTLCARPEYEWLDKNGSWLTDRYEKVYFNLYNEGLAHSFEVWDGNDLAGGTFGFLIGGVF